MQIVRATLTGAQWCGGYGKVDGADEPGIVICRTIRIRREGFP